MRDKSKPALPTIADVAAGSPRSRPAPPKARARAVPRAVVTEIFQRFQTAEPEPKGELTSLNAFTFLVAVVLSAQATDAGVNKATPALFALADTPAKMLALGEERVRDLIKTIGLFRTKAKNVIALSRRLLETFGGEVPDNRDDLESLPGVGRKTANVVLNNAYGVAVIAVDTHLFRVSNRIPLAPGKTPLEVELGLMKVIPDDFKRHAHHWLILHGRYVCKAKAPECPNCLISPTSAVGRRKRPAENSPTNTTVSTKFGRIFTGEPTPALSVSKLKPTTKCTARRARHAGIGNPFDLDPRVCLYGPRQAARDSAQGRSECSERKEKLLAEPSACVRSRSKRRTFFARAPARSDHCRGVTKRIARDAIGPCALGRVMRGRLCGQLPTPANDPEKSCVCSG